jgi:hypothetical protein
MVALITRALWCRTRGDKNVDTPGQADMDVDAADSVVCRKRRVRGYLKGFARPPRRHHR